MKRMLIFSLLCAAFLGCTQQGEVRLGAGTNPVITTVPQTALTIQKKSQLIGGPMAIGRIGDVLLSNDKIRVIIQKPGKNAGLGSFGGTIIDADRVQGSGDQFGELFPMINIEWTVNYYDFQVMADGKKGGPQVLRALGRIDVYDYLDIDFISQVAQGIAGQPLSFSNRFDDRRDPFAIYDDLKGVNPEVTTDYILEPGKNVVRIETTLENRGDKAVHMPVGQFINGSGELALLIPGVGFTPEFTAQIDAHTAAVLFVGYEGVDVSYGYFYDQREFLDNEKKPLKTSSISYAGLTAVVFGETFLKVLPLGQSVPPEINFTIPPGSKRKLTGYFVVGDGTAGSVYEAGLEALGIKTQSLVGRVLNVNGEPVEGATIAIKNKGGGTLATYRSNGAGNFEAKLPIGRDMLSKTYGKGEYTVAVEMKGHHLNGTTSAGSCAPESLDLSQGLSLVECRLGEAGRVEIAAPPIDRSTGSEAAARLVIVGEDPSPNKVGVAGVFDDAELKFRPYGIVDVKYIAANGTIGLTGRNHFHLEPGTYRFLFSHGPEYSVDDRVVEVTAGEVVTIADIGFDHVVETKGFIGADFHIHSINSPDSSISTKMRVMAAAAEALDVLQSSDHDYLTNYAPVVKELEAQGLIPVQSMQTAVGDEITPNHFGHLHAFPLEHDEEDVAGGALDWSFSPLDEISTAPDYSMGLSEIIAAVRADPGEEVIQMNHIADSTTSLPIATGWVTSPFYAEGFGVEPLSSYADPTERRLEVTNIGAALPLPFGTSNLVTADINAVELVNGQQARDADLLYRSAIPTWFNLLNLGVFLTATANSDSHTEIRNPLGLPRNYIVSSVDPRDGVGGGFGDIDLEEYAKNINAGRVVISAGPFVQVTARDREGVAHYVGETVIGSEIELEIAVTAPSWAWFDTIEVYTNTEPIPVDDVTGSPMLGTAADPAQFYNPYHVPKYTYRPEKSFRLVDGTLKSWNEEEQRITANVKTTLTFHEDTWIVVLVRGTRETEGYRSLFPVVTEVLVDSKKEPEDFNPSDLIPFHLDKKVGAPAWGLANPIYIDTDGNGFEAKHVRSGRSPISR